MELRLPGQSERVTARRARGLYSIILYYSLLLAGLKTIERKYHELVNLCNISYEKMMINTNIDSQ